MLSNWGCIVTEVKCSFPQKANLSIASTLEGIVKVASVLPAGY